MRGFGGPRVRGPERSRCVQSAQRRCPNPVARAPASEGNGHNFIAVMRDAQHSMLIRSEIL